MIIKYGMIHFLRKVCGLFFLDCFSSADWLGRQAAITWTYCNNFVLTLFFSLLNRCKSYLRYVSITTHVETKRGLYF